MSAPDVQFEVTPPQRWSRIQVLLRLVVLFALARLETRAGWILAAFYWLLPVVAALSIQQQGAHEYPLQAGRGVHRVLHWWSVLLAYLLCVIDRFPTNAGDLSAVRFEIIPSEDPSFGRALLRLLTSLPELLVVAVLGWVACLLAIIAAASILLVERVPAPIVRFSSFYLGLQARWLVYHASLVETHPLLDAPRWQPR
jgi:Domain of unknown function (DUF4389)